MSDKCQNCYCETGPWPLLRQSPLASTGAIWSWEGSAEAPTQGSGELEAELGQTHPPGPPCRVPFSLLGLVQESVISFSHAWCSGHQKPLEFCSNVHVVFLLPLVEFSDEGFLVSNKQTSLDTPKCARYYWLHNNSMTQNVYPWFISEVGEFQKVCYQSLVSLYLTENVESQIWLITSESNKWNLILIFNKHICLLW